MSAIQWMKRVTDSLTMSFRFGKVCSLVCSTGILIGSRVITCQASGQWTVITAQCIAQVPGSNNPPRGILLSSSSVPENSPHSTLVGRLTTVDPDKDQFFTYSLIDGADVFAIDNGTGTLIVAGDLDYETRSVYTVKLVSTDSGVPQMSVVQNLTLWVTDVNEPPSKLFFGDELLISI